MTEFALAKTFTETVAACEIPALATDAAIASTARNVFGFICHPFQISNKLIELTSQLIASPIVPKDEEIMWQEYVSLLSMPWGSVEAWQTAESAKK
jgi:hypothetical protein